MKNVHSKNATAREIPVEILKNLEFWFSKLRKCINIALAFKKLDPTDKTNFRPASLLSLLFNKFEKIMYAHLNESADKFTQRSMYFSDFFRNARKS